MIGLLVSALVLVVLLWAVRRIVAALGVPPPIATVIDVILVVVAVFWLISLLTGSAPLWPRPLLR